MKISEKFMIGIIEYGMGNIRSIEHKLKKEGFAICSSSEPEVLDKANKLILPGVGHFGKGMKNLKESGLSDFLTDKVINRKTPILGICLGIQLFGKFSEEGNCEGLKWIDAETKRLIVSDTNRKIPHVGWESLEIVKDSILFNGIPSDKRFYFTHSFHVVCQDSSDVIAKFNYGNTFVAAIQHENIYGTQFHPEKSHLKGMNVLINFCKGS